MYLNADHFARCLKTLESSLTLLEGAEQESIDYEIFRNAVVKGFELSLETGGKLIRKALKEFNGSPREVDGLTYKDLLRHAAKHGLMTTDAVERWFVYRDNRNSTAHDQGVGFAEETLRLLPDFVADARVLEATLRGLPGNFMLDLRPHRLEILRRLLAVHLPEAEVWAYGSRVRGTCHEGSDLDLVARNPGDLGRPQPDLSPLREALSESDIPVLVDILDWARIPESFRLEIARGGTAVVQAGKCKPPAEATEKVDRPAKGDETCVS